MALDTWSDYTTEYVSGPRTFHNPHELGLCWLHSSVNLLWSVSPSFRLFCIHNKATPPWKEISEAYSIRRIGDDTVSLEEIVGYIDVDAVVRAHMESEWEKKEEEEKKRKKKDKKEQKNKAKEEKEETNEKAKKEKEYEEKKDEEQKEKKEEEQKDKRDKKGMKEKEETKEEAKKKEEKDTKQETRKDEKEKDQKDSKEKKRKNEKELKEKKEEDKERKEKKDEKDKKKEEKREKKERKKKEKEDKEKREKEEREEYEEDFENRVTGNPLNALFRIIGQTGQREAIEADFLMGIQIVHRCGCNRRNPHSDAPGYIDFRGATLNLETIGARILSLEEEVECPRCSQPNARRVDRASDFFTVVCESKYDDITRHKKTGSLVGFCLGDNVYLPHLVIMGTPDHTHAYICSYDPSTRTFTKFSDDRCTQNKKFTRRISNTLLIVYKRQSPVFAPLLAIAPVPVPNPVTRCLQLMYRRFATKELSTPVKGAVREEMKKGGYRILLKKVHNGIDEQKEKEAAMRKLTGAVHKRIGMVPNVERTFCDN